MGANLTLYGQLARNSSTQPNKVAIIHNKEEITWLDLHKRVSVLAAYLSTSGLSFDNRVILSPDLSKSDFVISLLGLSAVGAVIVLIDNSNLALAINSLDISAIIVGNQNPGIEVIKDLHIINIDNIVKIQSKKLFDGVSNYPSEKLALLLYTSGTTGAPKCTMLSHGNLSATVENMAKFMNITKDIVEYMVAPLNHAFGLGRLRLILSVSGTMIFDDEMFNPARIILAIKNNDCNAISSVSSGFLLLINHFSNYLRDVGISVKWIEIGSMSMSKRDKESMLKYFPMAKIVMNYGMTESMRSTMLDLRKNTSKLHSVGKASNGNEVLIFDEKGLELPPNEKGEIVVKGSHLAMGYLGMNKVWKSQIQRGFYKTKDFGFKDEDGFIVFLGRKDEMINIKGLSLSPIELEEKVKKHSIRLIYV